MFRIEYELDDAGWADVTFSEAGWRVASRVSYLSDPLHELALGTLGLCDDRIMVDLDDVVFDAEGGGLRVRVDSAEVWETGDPDKAVLKVRLEDLAPDLPKPPPDLPHAFEIKGGDFARAVLDALESVCDRHGALGYHHRWLAADFPLAAMLRLRHELGLPPTERRLW